MKKMRLDDIFPTAYHLIYSDEWFRKKHKNTLAITHHPPHRFSICLKPRGISKSVQQGEVAPNP